MINAGASPQLDYAPRPPAFLWRRVWRWLIAVAVVCALLFCRNWPMQIWTRCRLLYLQSACLAHPVSGGAIVYASGTPEIVIASPQWAAFSAADSSISVSPAREPVATVFLGRLTAGNGLRALVEVEARVHWKPQGFSDVSVYSRAVRLGIRSLILENFQINGGPTSNADPGWTRSIPDLAVYSANADQNDPSHIRFECRVFQEDYMVDGYLQNDGRFVCTKWTDSRLPTTAPVPTR